MSQESASNEPKQVDEACNLNGTCCDHEHNNDEVMKRTTVIPFESTFTNKQTDKFQVPEPEDHDNLIPPEEERVRFPNPESDPDAFKKMLESASIDDLLQFQQQVLKQAPLDKLTMEVAARIFDDTFDHHNDNTSLAAELDPTGEYSALLLDRLNAHLEQEGLKYADRVFLHVYGRKAGTLFKGVPHKYGRVLVVEGFQTFVLNDRELVITTGNSSSIFSTTSTPRVPRGKTQIKLPNGKATIKNKAYRSTVLWIFWDDNPIAEVSNPHNEQGLQHAIEELQAKLDAEGKTMAEHSKEVLDGVDPDEPVTDDMLKYMYKRESIQL
jgi:hypothetical protein